MKNPFEYIAPSKSIQKVSNDTVVKFKDILPEILLDEWKREGLATYLGGLLWSTNPEDYYDVMAEWDEDHLNCHMIFLSAFGDFYFIKDGVIYAQAVHQKLRTKLQNNLRLVLKFSLARGQAQENILHKNLYKKAVKKFGLLESDEIFSFFPAIALGGDYDLNCVKKVKIKELLSFLGQL